MSEITLRPLRIDDWPAILELAELSLSELRVVPSQREWLDNRRSFSPSDGVQRHFVATSGDRIVGYAGVERRNEWPDGEFRLFVVVAPSDRRTLGTWLLAKLRDSLVALNARRAWLQELDADAGFISYLAEMGFVRVRAFLLNDGSKVVRLAMDAPFSSLE